MYTILLFLGFVFMNVMLVQSIQESMIREFSYFDETCEVAEEKKFGECSYIVGITMVLRICLALSSFHFILAVLTVKVANSSSWRGSVHNGMWGLKFCALCLIFLATFLIPVRDNNSDARTIFVVTLVAVLAALAFIIIKMVLIIAVIREWCYKWLKTLSKAAKKCVTWAMFLTSLGILIAVGFGFKFVYENYNRHEWCSYNLPVIIANGVLCLFLVIVSITANRGVEEHPAAVLFQTALMSAYVCYKTWSIIASEYSYIANDGSSDDKVVEQYCGPSLSTTVSNNAIICYVGIFMAFAAVIKETFSASNSAYKIGLKPPSSDCMDCCGNLEDSGLIEDGGQKVIRNEKDGVIYNYCFFHILFCFATMFIMMQLNNWQFEREKKITEVYQKSLSFVVKLISIYVVVVIYFSTLWCTKDCSGLLDRSRQVVEQNGRLEAI